MARSFSLSVFRRSVGFLGALATLLVVGCSPRETVVEAGRRDHVLHLGNQAEPATLDPHLINAFTDGRIITALLEGLTVLDERTSEALPGVAERWEVSPDGLTYTFHLRASARWSNGEPVTARDFVYAFERILRPSFAAEYAYMLFPLKNAEAFNAGKITAFTDVGAQAVDDHTLRLTLERPTPYLPALVTHATWMPVHRATMEANGGPADRTGRWTKPETWVGNGPFVLTEWKANARLVVKRNPRYWDNANTTLESVVFYPIENPETEERAYRAGQLHITYDLPKSKLAPYRGQSPSPLRVDPLLKLVYLNFNVTKPPFTDARVRRALSLAIDRDAIANQVLNGAWPAARSFTPPDCGPYTSRAQVPTDFAEARRLLAASGFPEGKGFPSVPVQVLNDTNQPRMMEAIQAMWKKELGITITIEPYEQKTWLQNQQTMAHQLALLGWTGDFADPVTFLALGTTGNGNNWSGWSDATYDRLIAQAADTTDAKARLELFQQAEARLLEAAPFAPIVYPALTYALHPSVKGWDPAPLGLHRYNRVRLE